MLVGPVPTHHLLCSNVRLLATMQWPVDVQLKKKKRFHIYISKKLKKSLIMTFDSTYLEDAEDKVRN